jgi:transcriptional antiterminator NusG
VKRGKKVQVERKFMPGYVLAKLTMNDDVYHLVKNTPKVTGFLGASGKPQPISEREAARYFGAREQAAAQPRHQVSVDYEIGDSVKVYAGPFAQLQRHRRGTTISTSSGSRYRSRSFGRATPVELSFEEVETGEVTACRRASCPIETPRKIGVDAFKMLTDSQPLQKSGIVREMSDSDRF